MDLEISGRTNTLTRCKPLLGTYVEISVSGDVTDETLIEQSNSAFAAIQLVQREMSFHDAFSELSIINQNALNDWIELSPSMFKVLSKIDQLNNDTYGSFDPSIAPVLLNLGSLPRHKSCDHDAPTAGVGVWRNVELGDHRARFHSPAMLDLGGIAKGFAVDQALACIDSSLVCTVNAGGDIGMSHWQEQSIDILFGSKDSRATKEMEMRNSCLASSASYRNDGRSVIVDPKSAQPQKSNNTYSVFAPDCMTADALTKAAWLGTATPEIINKHNASILVLDQHGQSLH
ncbi:MAG: thiamine biosynthesis lipoprotein [Arenicella sp.]|jgi:thiamine biosynthesis lipoprotein